MTVQLHPASRSRVLVIARPDTIADVLAEHANNRPVVALLASTREGPTALESVVQALLTTGCEYFVCWGDDSEALHDRVDELLLECIVPDPTRTVMTTWHDDELAADVAEFFFNVAGKETGALLVAVLEENDAEMARLLAGKAATG